MEKQSTPSAYTLSAPAGVPFPFEVQVRGNALNYHFQVRASETGDTDFNYVLEQTEHDAYLDLFASLHADFALRLPQNRKPAKDFSFQMNYQEQLTENLDAGMLYGYGDPAIIRVEEPSGSCYYVVSTSNDAPNAFPIVRSENLKDWTFCGYVFPEGQTPSWCAVGEMHSDFWAPELHEVAGEYRLYFVARDKDSGDLCIGYARAASATGPFTADLKPIIAGNVIDPHIFKLSDDSTYLFWKEDNNDVWPAALISLLHKRPELINQLFNAREDRKTASFIVTVWPWLETLEPMQRFLFSQVFIEAVIDQFTSIYNKLNALADAEPSMKEAVLAVTSFMKTPVYACALSEDGQSLVGERLKVLENDLDWEAHLVEGIWVSLHQERYYLFYAGNDFSTNQYGIGVAIATSPLGPYQKLPAPILRSTEKWRAPGHPSIALDLQGQPTMFLHAFFPGKAGYKQFRALLSVPLSFERDSVHPG